LVKLQFDCLIDLVASFDFLLALYYTFDVLLVVVNRLVVLPERIAVQLDLLCGLQRQSFPVALERRWIAAENFRHFDEVEEVFFVPVRPPFRN
jgi:hypothetical protein